MRDFLAKIFRSLEIRQDSAKAQEADFIEKCSGLLAWCDHATCSWRTSQRSFLEGWEPFSETWPRAGMTVAGVAWKHRQSERRIAGIGGGCSPQWPTPTRSDANGPGKHGTGGMDLRTTVRQRCGQLTDPAMGAIQAGGKLNPTWVEWLMGWPLGWTELQPLETGRFREWLQQHGGT